MLSDIVEEFSGLARAPAIRLSRKFEADSGLNESAGGGPRVASRCMSDHMGADHPGFVQFGLSNVYVELMSIDVCCLC